MIEEFHRIEQLLFGKTTLKISNLVENKEAKDYLGFSFDAGKYKFIFRKSKITPKKTGQFVTLWKRNSNQKTEPYHKAYNFDYCIIIVQEKDKCGLFLFPKDELIKQAILSTESKEGKRGFRVYPNWTKTVNKHAEKTQLWQAEYFYNYSTSKNRPIFPL